jgi:hypothetical protein
MVRTGRRALALREALVDAGLEPAAAPPAPRVSELGDRAEDALLLYRRLGGLSAGEERLRPGSWDLAFSGSLVVELDEELHFNRYRAVTLSESWAASLPWTEPYRGFCNEHEPECLRAGTWGRRWTTPSCERMFGEAGPAGELGGVGSPRWRQRAFYDAVKDLAAVGEGSLRVARISVYDSLDGARLGDVLDGRRAAKAASILQLIANRTA